MAINIDDITPVTREEKFMAGALGLVDASDIKPVTRAEVYLKAIAENGTGGEGASTANKVSYSNETLQTANVKTALDKIIDKLYYVKPVITTFNVTPVAGVYEIGTTLSNLTFNWAYNKDITTQTLDGVTLANETVRTGTYTKSVTSTKSFTLTASDGENSVTAKKDFTFTNKVWYGSAPIKTYNDSFILGLSTGKLQTSKSGNYTVNVANNEYFFIAMPTSYNNSDEIVGKIGGFETSFSKVATINHTNASGYTTNYNIYKSGNHSLGSVTFVI